MAEFGIPYQLVTPVGTLGFNAYAGDYLRLTGVDGMDAAELRGGGTVLMQRDGGIPGDRFRNPLFPVFQGEIVAASLTGRRVLEDTLRSYLAALARADGTLSWTPSGTTARQRVVRLDAGPQIAGGLLKSFQFVLEAHDPLAYSTVEQTSADIAANGAALNVTNGGNAPTWPKLRIYGAVTNPVLRNNTSGKRVELDYGAGLVIPDGTYVEIDTRRSQVVLVSTGASQIGAFDPLVSEFFQLAAGVNAIALDGAAPGVNAKATVIWRDAWWG